MHYTGSCLCQGVNYSINTAIDSVDCCHCSVCRKSHASAFSMGVTISRADFELDSGRELLAEYASSEAKRRVFCRQCGTQLWAYRPDQPEQLRLRVATLDADLEQFAISHIYTDTRLANI